jgi:hypothetical protein
MSTDSPPQFNNWPKHPFIYELNTWVWLQDLSQTRHRPVTLADVPDEAWEALTALCPDAVWLMGVWERSPAGIQISNKNVGLVADFQRALPDFTIRDNIGSPYCVRRYVVDECLGGPAGLAEARRQLAQRGIRLILDFVPNHVAPDHPWVIEHPEYFIQGTPEDLENDPAAFLKVNDRIIACGKDPYFPAWPDVLQLNAFQTGLRQAAAETVADIAAQCDGLRCDMAMLVMNSIFDRTWGKRAGARPEHEYWPEQEYWSELIGHVKRQQPDLIFIAEAYWDLEWDLQQQGFDYCYDKRLYDRLEQDHAESVWLHLQADLDYQEKLLRFIENHDEPRAASTFSPDKQRAVAVVAATLPGATLFHEGQLEGRQVRLPVFLGRCPPEPVNRRLRTFYRKLLAAIQMEAIREGEWQLCEREGWPDNQSHLNIVTWGWHHAEEYCLIVVNLSPRRSQALVRLPWPRLTDNGRWELQDMLTGEIFERDGREMLHTGMYVELDGWGRHFLKITPAAGSTD